MKIILLCLISFASLGQRGFSIMSMDVLETDIMGRRSRYDSITVVWGVYYDTIAFHYNDKLIKLWALKEDSHDYKVLRAYRRQLEGMGYVENVILLQDDIGDKWLFRLSQSKSGLMIFLNNLSRGRPYILFDLKKANTIFN